MTASRQRPEDWPERLAAYLAGAAKRGFAWGGNDCVLFGANWVRDLTGADPVKGLRGRWKTEAGAARVIARLGGDLEALAAARLEALGFEEVAPGRAMRGDVVLHVFSSGPAIGIVADTRAAFLTTAVERERGPLLFLPAAATRRAWRIC